MPQSALTPLTALLDKTRQHLTRVFKDEVPACFWESDNMDAVEEGFYFLAGDLMLADIEAESVPLNFVHMMCLFMWEMESASGGWSAFNNLTAEECNRVLSAFEFVGLDDEAMAIGKARKVWELSAGNPDETRAAYESVPNNYSDESDRIPYLVQHFRSVLSE